MLLQKPQDDAEVHADALNDAAQQIPPLVGHLEARKNALGMGIPPGRTLSLQIRQEQNAVGSHGRRLNLRIDKVIRAPALFPGPALLIQADFVFHPVEGRTRRLHGAAGAIHPRHDMGHVDNPHFLIKHRLAGGAGHPGR